MLKRCLFAFIFTLAIGVAGAQNGVSTELSGGLYQQALGYQQQKQNRKADSILNLTGIRNHLESDSKLSTAIITLKALLKHNAAHADSALFYYRNALGKFRRQGNEEEVVSTYKLLSRNFLRVRNVDSAFHYIDAAIQFDALKTNPGSYIRDLSSKADLHLYIGQTAEGLQQLDLARHISEQEQDTSNIRKILLQTATVYMNVGEFEKAEKFLLEAQLLLSSYRDSVDVVLEWRKTNLYYQWGKYAIADSVNRVARNNCDSTATPSFYGILLMQASRLALARDQLSKANQYAERADAVVQMNRPLNGLAKIYLLKSRIATSEMNYEAANFWIDSALVYGEQLFAPLVRLRLYHQKLLVSLYRNDSVNYQRFQEKYDGIRDSISGIENLRAVLDHELDLANESMTDQLSALSSQLASEKASGEFNTFLLIIIGSGTLLLVLFGIWFRRRMLNKKQVLEEQHENLSHELERKQEEIEKMKDAGTLVLEELPSHLEPLSKREKDVFELLIEGLTDKEISEKLHISLPTVRTHTRHIYEKLHINSRIEAKIISLKYKVLDE